MYRVRALCTVVIASLSILAALAVSPDAQARSVEEVPRFSLGYIRTDRSDPNLNGDLVCVSLRGANPQVLLRGINGFTPCANGAIMAVRRTSRSGHDLLFLAADRVDQPIKLASAFAFGALVLSPNGKQWAALVRTGVGSGWSLMRGDIGSTVAPRIIELPERSARPRLWWDEGGLLLQLDRDRYEMAADAAEWRPTTRSSTDGLEFVLNKSQTLTVEEVESNGKPSVKVAVRWFTGSEDAVATVAGLRLTGFELTPDKRFLLVTGHVGDASRAVVVDVPTGEVIDALKGVEGQVRLLDRAQPVGKS